MKDLKSLAKWYEARRRILPWREDPTPYRVWISEIMLQQTQVATVIPYFERFIARFPDVKTLASASASEDDVMLHWAGLGYYSRARNLLKTAREVAARGGVFPDDRLGWEALPGIGPYTAGAILSIAYDQPEAILDGNVERVLSRHGRVTRAQGDAAFKARLWKASREWVERANERGIRPSVLNQALMELGATLCKSRGPDCAACPLSKGCEARKRGDAEDFPPRKKPKEWIEKCEEVHCVVNALGEVLLRRSAQSEWRAGLWDFPGELPLSAGIEKLLEIETRHVVTRHRVRRVTCVWRLGCESWSAAESSDWAWQAPHQLEVAVGSAFRKSCRQVCLSLGFPPC